MRLAHFSDVHLTLSPFATPWRELTLKRAANAVSYYFAGRHWRYADGRARIEALLADVDAQRPDHVLCTGDVSATALPQELAGVAALFGRLHPERFTLIPGNHDRYVRRSLGAFERHFGEQVYPFAKPLGGVTVVCIDVVRPTGLFHSTGLCGDGQRRALRQLLDGLHGQFVVLALHYGLLRADGSRDRRGHSLRDDRELLALIDDPSLPVDLVLHGHLHMPYSVQSARRHLVCAGSASDLSQPCGYNLYDIDLSSRRVRVQRRQYTPRGFVDADESWLEPLTAASSVLRSVV